MDGRNPRVDVKLTCPPSSEWIVEKYAAYLKGKRYTVYAHGTCVVWGEIGGLVSSEANSHLRSVAAGRPDFKVRRHSDGNYLVTFRGGVTGLVSEEFFVANFDTLKEWAKTSGMFASEKFLVDRSDGDAVTDLVAGLYARANLFKDALELNVL